MTVKNVHVIRKYIPQTRKIVESIDVSVNIVPI